MASASEDDIMDTAGDLDDDLFGSDEGGEKVQELSDRELDSSDDEDRYDRARERDDAEGVDTVSGRNVRVLPQTLYRHPLPNPSDGEVSL
jgi:RNA polymerase-associated protein LEO1